MDKAMNTPLSERVRILFNEDARSWIQLYQPRRKMAWRLDEFHRAVARWIPVPARVLDFGCGTGNLAEHLQNRGYEVTACDFADEMIAVACHSFGKSGVEWVKLSVDWRHLPYSDGAFDAVVASSVFEYLEDCDFVFGELARVLRRGGVLVISVPDPHHPKRKLEHLIGWLTTPSWIRNLACSIPSIRKHLHHVELSKNRWARDRWEDKAGQHGFRSLQGADSRSSHPALVLLSFRRDV